MVQFNEDEAQNLSKNVRKISSQLRQQLKQVEKKIRLYINDELSDADNDLQFQIKDNMSQNILTELNEIGIDRVSLFPDNIEALMEHIADSVRLPQIVL